MVAETLGEDLRQRLVFAGECTTAHVIIDKVTLEDAQTADDVDLIGYASWADMQITLRERGFTETLEDQVICSMRLGELKVVSCLTMKPFLGHG